MMSYPQRKKTYAYKKPCGTFTMEYTTVKGNPSPHTHHRDTVIP